jgi:selenocysteine lyase/cysteine desulfurase
MYAPFGTGALVGQKEFFLQGDPDMPGGGTVKVVTVDGVVWAGPPDRDEAGSPNVVGAVGLALAIKSLEEIGMEAVQRHESDLTAYALDRFDQIPEIRVYGNNSHSDSVPRLGVIPFEIDGLSHFLVASILGHEWGIGVRNGCFCAHPYILHLLGLSREEANNVRVEIEAGNKRDMPGLVRVSFGLYNTTDEIDVLIEALQSIIGGESTGNYVQDHATGEFHPENWEPDFESFFEI